MTKVCKVGVRPLAFAIGILSVAVLSSANDLIEKSAVAKAQDTTLLTNKGFYDPNTCGPTVVYVVLKLYGKSVPLEDIGKEVLIDADGRASIKSVSRALMKRGIYARGRKLTLKELQKQSFPAIILAKSQSCLGENHFLVYLGSDEKNIKLLDPLGSKALKLVPKQYFCEEWTGIGIVTQLTPFVEFERNRSRRWNILMVGSTVLFLSIGSIMIWSKLPVQKSTKREKL
ncbi:MAG: cysteine peptidase family C39 domain-containing protein [Planctomycetota bacterium]|jgi:ABC-type bacteriocin/lantibiotic exporter with double-glycine peptidase domain